VPGFVDIIGIALATNPVYVNGELAYRKGEYFRRELSVNNATAPVWQQVTVTASGETPVTGNVYVPKTPEAFSYDLDGNMTSDGRWNYTWDAENRLIRVESRSDTPQASWRRVEWQFDALGRRIRQTTWMWNTNSGTWQVGEDLKFISDPLLFGRHIVELNGTNNMLVRSYVWGLDLSGTMDGAGGVGGLLWICNFQSPIGHHFVAYDGNGNVVALVSATTGTETARYEYGPFGEVLRVTGPAARQNPFRFSTKRTDNTTDLVLYEYRAYNPGLGRWISRDPLLVGIDLDEATVRSQAVLLYYKLSKGQSLDYVGLGNYPTVTVDPLGLADCKSVRFTRSDDVPLGGFAGLDFKLSEQYRITVTTCRKCCPDGGIGYDIITTTDYRYTIEGRSPEAVVAVLGIPIRISIFGGGSGGALVTTTTDTCFGNTRGDGCFFFSARLGAQGCGGIPRVSEVCLRCEANYTRRWCPNFGSSGCWSGRCMVRARFLTRIYDFVFWQTEPCSSTDIN